MVSSEFGFSRQVSLPWPLFTSSTPDEGLTLGSSLTFGWSPSLASTFLPMSLSLSILRMYETASVGTKVETLPQWRCYVWAQEPR